MSHNGYCVGKSLCLYMSSSSSPFHLSFLRDCMEKTCTLQSLSTVITSNTNFYIYESTTKLHVLLYLKYQFVNCLLDISYVI